MDLAAKGLSLLLFQLELQYNSKSLVNSESFCGLGALKNLKLHSKYSFTITVEIGRFICERKGLWHRGSIFSLHLADSSLVLAK